MALSRDTAIIGYPSDDCMGYDSGSVYFYFRRYNGTWEEVHKITPTDGEAGDWFGSIVSIFGDTAVIGAIYDNNTGSNTNRGSGYLYTKIVRKLIENGKKVSEDGLLGGRHKEDRSRGTGHYPISLEHRKGEGWITVDVVLNIGV